MRFSDIIELDAGSVIKWVGYGYESFQGIVLRNDQDNKYLITFWSDNDWGIEAIPWKEIHDGRWKVQYL